VKLKKDKLKVALDILAKEANLLVPMEIDGITKFASWGTEGKLALDAVNTLLPPKDALFPQTEKMYAYKASAQGTEIKEYTERTKQIISASAPATSTVSTVWIKSFLPEAILIIFTPIKGIISPSSLSAALKQLPPVSVTPWVSTPIMPRWPTCN
jgi:hypothetical protein